MSEPVTVFDVVLAIQERTKAVGPSLDDERELARPDSPPRYVWVHVGIDTGPPKGGGSYAAPQAPAIFWDVHRFEVHCWGRDKLDALELRRCLLKAAREQLGGLAAVRRTVPYGGESHVTKGWAYVVELLIPFPVLDEPIGPLPAEPYRATGTAIATQSVFDVPIGTPGDRGLTHGDD